MKGIVFTEFLGFVGARYGEDAVDDIIGACQLASGGAYTSVGTYDHAEVFALCQALSKSTGEPVADLIRDFGAQLSSTFAKGHPDFFARCNHFFDFLESIEAYIHKAVRKLYPDAELPTFTVHQRCPTRLVLDYASPRRMGTLAEGLIVGSADRFGVQALVRAESLDGGDGQRVRFVIDMPDLRSEAGVAFAYG